ncbi:MAG TPA: hypothetical protein ENN65_00835 [Candidatus Hydrogenedentes bacterium]|nr:hypothetical protein [Candidatus Hydrogenedentota bacterium]
MDIQTTYEDVLQRAEKLPPGQRLLLIEHLLRQMRNTQAGQDAYPVWEDYAASAPYPLCGEDAQAWVSRTRRESDESRGQQ